MNAAELAALIAAVFWALLACVGVVVLLRLGRLLSESTKLVAEMRERADVLLQRAQAAVDGAQAAVDRAGEQLDRTEAVLAQGGGPTGTARSRRDSPFPQARLAPRSRGDSPSPQARLAPPSWEEVFPPGPPRPPVPPWGRTAALAYGVRHAVGLRRAARRTLPGRVVERGELARSGKAVR